MFFNKWITGLFVLLLLLAINGDCFAEDRSSLVIGPGESLVLGPEESLVINGMPGFNFPSQQGGPKINMYQQNPNPSFTVMQTGTIAMPLNNKIENQVSGLISALSAQNTLNQGRLGPAFETATLVQAVPAPRSASLSYGSITVNGVDLLRAYNASSVMNLEGCQTAARVAKDQQGSVRLGN